MATRLFIALMLATWSVLAAAQGKVYESRDKAGPVFSDQSSSGAKPVELGPANVIQGDPLPKQKPVPAAPAPYYTALAISSPVNGGTIHTNTGAFDVSVQLTPALRTSGGDRIKAKLDGRMLTRSFRSAKFGVTDADWQKNANPDDAQHTLQVVVLDKAGAVLIESAPVKFEVRRNFRSGGK